MRTHDPEDESHEPVAGHRAELSGHAADVVQARDVHGGVHFHGVGPADQPIPRQLPGDVRGFVNRLDELARLDDVLAGQTDEPLVAGLFVITGTAGVGKTSLALHWAHSARRRFPGGQLYVNLRGYDPGPPVSPEQALDRFLRALGVQPASMPVELEDRAALYRSLLADRRMLIVLDNAATVRQVRPLLPGNSECLVLVTSRSRLSGLVARDGAQRLSLDVLTEREAIDLLRVITAGYRSHDDPADVLELARLCARLPLALRIAAERASSRPLMLLTELIADLRDESALWSALTAEDDEEADAVRTVFAWSYRALPEAAARLFRLLGLHPGPEFGLAVAAALTGASTSQVKQLLDVLVGAHMLEQHAPGRYQFHDLLRAYAADQATERESTDDRRSALNRVLVWYLHTVDAAVGTLAPRERRVVADPPDEAVVPLTFVDPDAAFRWYELEHTNLVAATRAAAEAGLHPVAWRIPATLASIYVEQNPFEEWIATGLVGLGSAQRVDDRYGEAQLLDSLGRAYLQSGRLTEADEFYRRALVARGEIGDRSGMAMSINALGLLDWRRRRLLDALAHFEQSLAIIRESGDRRWEALLLGNLGMTYCDLDRVEQAVQVLGTAVAISRELDDRSYEGNALFFLAMAQRQVGDTGAALISIEATLAISGEGGRTAWGAYWLLELARVQRALELPAEALASYQRSATIQRQLGDRGREAMALDGAGEAYQELGRLDEAAKFHLLAAATHRELGDRWHLAVALVNLGTALAGLAAPEQAHPHLAEAAAILTEFDDPRAVRLRERSTQLMAT